MVGEEQLPLTGDQATPTIKRKFTSQVYTDEHGETVPYRSPFRYPGGKTWLVPRVRRWLASLKRQRGHYPVEFVEPFAGGGIVGVTVAAEALAAHVTLIEKDPDVAAVWQTMLNRNARLLAQDIRDFDIEEATAFLDGAFTGPMLCPRQRALRTIVANRVAHGGKITASAGRLKAGERGKGLRSRWYPDTLAARIVSIAALKDRLTFRHGDGVWWLQAFARAGNPDCAFFIDPPYTAGGQNVGRGLYTLSNIDHERLFRVATALAGPFLMTYDDNEQVRDLVERHGFAIQEVTVRNTSHEERRELLISNDLSWLTSEPDRPSANGVALVQPPLLDHLAFERDDNLTPALPSLPTCSWENSVAESEWSEAEVVLVTR